MRVFRWLVVILLVTPGAWLLSGTAVAAPRDPQLSGWSAERVHGRHLPDPVRATPAEIARFFAGLGPGAAADLAARYPHLVGNLDGAPPPVRLAVNKGFLVYDRTGDGRIAQVFGDLTTAERIAVLVPGVDNRLANFATGHGRVQRRAPAWQARQLFDEAVALQPGARVAVVAWLGYDPPEGIGREAIREERAEAGAAALVRFVDGLVAYRPDARISVFGHSYGSVVAGLAAASLSPRVGDLVAVASPGMGVDRAADLHTHARVWAGAARSDWIHRVPGVRLLGLGHGTLPSDPEFGARPLPTDGVADHDGYFMPGTAALRGMAGILLGSQ